MGKFVTNNNFKGPIHAKGEGVKFSKAKEWPLHILKVYAGHRVVILITRHARATLVNKGDLGMTFSNLARN